MCVCVRLGLIQELVPLRFLIQAEFFLVGIYSLTKNVWNNNVIFCIEVRFFERRKLKTKLWATCGSNRFGNAQSLSV